MARNNERLTYRDENGKSKIKGEKLHLALEKLAAYEDTGLTPANIVSMMIATRQYSMINVGTLFKANGIDVDERIEELLNKK
jgi:hypothetical protein